MEMSQVSGYRGVPVNPDTSETNSNTLATRCFKWICKNKIATAFIGIVAVGGIASTIWGIARSTSIGERNIQIPNTVTPHIPTTPKWEYRPLANKISVGLSIFGLPKSAESEKWEVVISWIDNRGNHSQTRVNTYPVTGNNAIYGRIDKGTPLPISFQVKCNGKSRGNMTVNDNSYSKIIYEVRTNARGDGGYAYANVKRNQ